MNRSPETVDEKNVPTINVRAAALADAEAISRIYNDYVDVGGATFDTVHWSLDLEVRPF